MRKFTGEFIITSLFLVNKSELPENESKFKCKILKLSFVLFNFILIGLLLFSFAFFFIRGYFFSWVLCFVLVCSFNLLSTVFICLFLPCLSKVCEFNRNLRHFQKIKKSNWINWWIKKTKNSCNIFRVIF